MKYKGNTGMIDVGQKEKTHRIAKAQAFVKLGKVILKKVKNNEIPKGNVVEMARTASIFSAKNTPRLIPLCHIIEIEYANTEFTFKSDGILIESQVSAHAKTGVEMEALTACTIAALTIYDMCKMFSKEIEIQDICLLKKTGGKSGEYVRKSVSLRLRQQRGKQSRSDIRKVTHE